MHRHLTPSSSLESLKKEAKCWLEAVRGDDSAALHRLLAAYPQRPNSAVCLRDIQHALALEYGAESWLALRERLQAVPAAVAVAEAPDDPITDLPDYESLANDMLAAYKSGNADALRRVSAHYQRQFTCEDLQAWAWHRLYRVRQSKTMTLSDAQTLIARDAGYGKWTTFMKSAAAGAPLLHVPYSIDFREKTIAPSRQLDDNDWDRILSAAESQRITAIHARGHLTDSALKRLSMLDHVTSLSLGNSKQVTEEGLKHLANMPQLRVLELGGGGVTDTALEVLRHLPELRSFQMCWQAGVSDAGIANLSFCDRLESVNLLGSTTGDGAIASLAHKAQLRRLKTGRNVTDVGLKHLHEIPLFKAWSGGTAKYSLMSADAEPTHLLIDGPFTDEGVSALAGPNGLDGLYGLSLFWHCTSVTPRCLAQLTEMAHLGFLGVEGKLCNDEAMSYIAELPHLKMLMAQGTVATDGGFAALSQSGTLEYIWGRECPNLTGRGFAALSKLRKLCGLAVSCKNVDDQSLAALSEFPALRELMPMDVSDEGFRYVGACKKLEKLWCMYCRDTTDSATEHFANLTKLKSYYAGATGITDRSLKILGSIASLESLEFWECAGITDDGLKFISELTRLKKVGLNGMAQVTEAGPTVFPARVHVEYSV